MRNLTILSIFIGITLVLVFCNPDLTPNPVSQFRNVRDSVAYSGMQNCRLCHVDIYDTFIETGMGKSFDFASREKSAASFGEHDLVYDAENNLYYKPFFQDSSLFVKEYRLEGKDTVHARTEKISYVIGSGQHTNSHLLNINGYIYQAPVTFYTQEGRWDLAPGFEKNNVRFARVIEEECLTCHNHYPTFVEGSVNKVEQMPRGIACERCHGPGALHVKEKLAGKIIDTAYLTDYSIVNPQALPRDLQMDLCQRCHLQGIAVLEEGKTFYDFKPGMHLNEVANVFLPRFVSSDKRFIMASQADRLRLSPCYVNSETLTCITCHNPHKSIEVTGKDQYNNACKSCHSTQSKSESKVSNQCIAPLAERQAVADNCVECHMPKSGSIDIPHVRITDHNISRASALRNKSGVKNMTTTKSELQQFLGLEILTKKIGSPLEMALGYLAYFDKYRSDQVILDSISYYLKRSKAPFSKTYKAQVHYLFSKHDYAAIIALSEKLPAAELDDHWTLYRIGQSFLNSSFPKKAVEYFSRACELMPYHLEYREKLGLAYMQTKDYQTAKEIFQFVLKENPRHALSACNLGFVYMLENNPEKAEIFYDQAIDLNPDYEQALINKAAVRLMYKDNKVAKRLISRVLKINPKNSQALQALTFIK